MTEENSKINVIIDKFHSSKCIHNFGDLSVIPIDVLLYRILPNLSLSEFASVSLLNKSFLELIERDFLWKEILKAEDVIENDNELSWKYLCRKYFFRVRFDPLYCIDPFIFINKDRTQGYNTNGGWRNFGFGPQKVNRKTYYFQLIDPPSLNLQFYGEVMFGIIRNPDPTNNMWKNSQYPGSGSRGLSINSLYDSIAWWPQLTVNDYVEITIDIKQKKIFFKNLTQSKEVTADWPKFFENENQPVMLYICSLRSSCVKVLDSLTFQE